MLSVTQAVHYSRFEGIFSDNYVHYCITAHFKFELSSFTESLRDPEIQKVAVLVLGALAGHQWQAGHEAQAESIVVNIEDKLGVHGEYGMSVVF